MAVNSLFNDYALENVALGLNKPNEKIPFEQYVTDLQIQALRPYEQKKFVKGSYINENLQIIDRNKEEPVNVNPIIPIWKIIWILMMK